MDIGCSCWTRILVVADGHGLAHMRRFGVACHLGVLTDTAAIGCAKKILVGKHEPLGEEKNNFEYIEDKGEVVGAVLRTRKKVKPIYISVGHKMLLDQAVEIMQNCALKYRIPEPTRQAHLLVNELRRGELEVS